MLTNCETESKVLINFTATLSMDLKAWDKHEYKLDHVDLLWDCEQGTRHLHGKTQHGSENMR